MLELDLSFAHSYDVEEPPELPASGTLKLPLHYFPRPGARAEHDGLWLKTVPGRGSPWVGVFAFGYQSPPAISRVVSSPDPSRVCVISKGAAYVVKAEDPDSWDRLPVTPVLDVRAIPEHQLLIFSDFTRLAAYGRNGLAWRSDRVCWDSLKILHITRDTIEGSGYDPTKAKDSRFVVDIKTGRPLILPPASADDRALW